MDRSRRGGGVTEETDETEPMPFPDTELTAEERKALRRLIRDDERATWAWKKLRVLVPAAVAVTTAIWQGWEAIRPHWR